MTATDQFLKNPNKYTKDLKNSKHKKKKKKKQYLMKLVAFLLLLLSDAKCARKPKTSFLLNTCPGHY